MVRAASDLSATAAWKATRRSLLSAVCVGLALFLAAPLIVQGLTSLAALAFVGGAVAATVNAWEERVAVLAVARRLLPGQPG